MTRTAFTDGQILMAAQLQNVHDSGGVVVASTTEMNLLPTTVKTCWYSGYTYRRNSSGTWVQDGADKVVGYPYGVRVTDWNDAVNTGFYTALAGAANDPANGIGNTSWMVMVIAFNSTYTHQIAWPSGIYSPNVMIQRARVNNAWTDWQRNNNYDYSWSGIDNLTFLQHAQAGKGVEGVRRFAHGFVKDSAKPATASALDEWRVQCYDLNGNFTWSAIKIQENGVVDMPRNTLRLGPEAQTLGVEGSEEPVSPDQILTVGSLMEILDKVLTPTQKTKLNNLLTVAKEDESNGTE